MEPQLAACSGQQLHCELRSKSAGATIIALHTGRDPRRFAFTCQDHHSNGCAVYGDTHTFEINSYALLFLMLALRRDTFG